LQTYTVLLIRILYMHTFIHVYTGISLYTWYLCSQTANNILLAPTVLHTPVAANWFSACVNFSSVVSGITCHPISYNIIILYNHKHKDIVLKPSYRAVYWITHAKCTYYNTDLALYGIFHLFTGIYIIYYLCIIVFNWRHGIYITWRVYSLCVCACVRACVCVCVCVYI